MTRTDQNQNLLKLYCQFAIYICRLR